jgi:hypothetical protein
MAGIPPSLLFHVLCGGVLIMDAHRHILSMPDLNLFLLRQLSGIQAYP